MPLDASLGTPALRHILRRPEEEAEDPEVGGRLFIPTITEAVTETTLQHLHEATIIAVVPTEDTGKEEAEEAILLLLVAEGADETTTAAAVPTTALPTKPAAVTTAPSPSDPLKKNETG
mmetsp:Transcript_12352/g.19895  ORF Transcript_12352/g.19895 Transcript_12352/m.19895 type:complete len:119 (-) Transcript_12352:160-516(-)